MIEIWSYIIKLDKCCGYIIHCLYRDHFSHIQGLCHFMTHPWEYPLDPLGFIQDTPSYASLFEPYHLSFPAPGAIPIKAILVPGSKYYSLKFILNPHFHMSSFRSSSHSFMDIPPPSLESDAKNLPVLRD